MSSNHQSALQSYVSAITSHTAASISLRDTRTKLQALSQTYDHSENNVKALQYCGQTIATILQQIGPDKFIVKASNGPRYVVGIKKSVKDDLQRMEDQVFHKRVYTGEDDIESNDACVTNDNYINNPSKIFRSCVGYRVTLDTLTLTIMRILPPEINPSIYKMSVQDPGKVSFSDIGGLSTEIRDFQEVIKLSLTNPQIFTRVGITPPKGVLLYGPPGTGKTLLARAIAQSLNVNFLSIVSSAIIEKYIGESARCIREMFNYAREHQPCILFMDEIDAIGGKRSSDSNSSDREVQRTLMELLAQMDGFSPNIAVKVIMATNRPDILDEALLRPGRLDRKIEIGLPNEAGRKEILGIYSRKMRIGDNVDFGDGLMELIVRLSVGFNGADLRNVCTEAGMLAIRDERDFVVKDDFVKAVRKIAETKKLESKMEYKKR